MAEIGIYTTVVITMLGVAYPIFLQVIARLDEKYTSDHVVELFDKERIGIFFKRILIAALFAISIWSFKFQPLFQLEGFNFIINNSADILVISLTILLVIYFFLILNKILVYYNPSKFTQDLISNHNKTTSTFIFFQALTDIFLHSIRNQNTNISLTISRFYYSAFKKEREKFKDTPVEYPDLYYELVHKSIEELVILKDKRNYALEYRTAGGVWLLGEFSENEISEKTYSWLWRNLLLAVGRSNLRIWGLLRPPAHSIAGTRNDGLKTDSTIEFSTIIIHPS